MSVIIGISMGYKSNNEKKLEIDKNYLQVIKEVGGIPVILNPFINEKYFNKINIDGILLTGGGDVDPRYFGDNPHKKIRRIDPVRDNFEIKLCKWAIKSRLPVLAICRGIQVLNIAYGGTIIQHLDGDIIKHEQESPGWHPSHKINISDNNILADIYDKREIYVNSFHHQAVLKTGNGLEIVARAVDGIIESIASSDKYFIIGVQWHPELMYKKNSKHLKLFKRFIKNCE